MRTKVVQELSQLIQTYLYTGARFRALDHLKVLFHLVTLFTNVLNSHMIPIPFSSTVPRQSST